jgi:hypothetical protein
MNVLHELVHSSYDAVACDPGQSGSVVRVGRGQVKVWRGFKTLGDITSAVVDACGQVLPSFVVVELVSAMPGQGVCSMFSFGKSTGAFYGAFYAYSWGALHTGLPLDEVSPQKWQNWAKKKLGLVLGAGEFDSTKIIETYLPQYADLFRKRPRRKGELGNLDHNGTDALLIGLWRLGSL